MHISHMRKIIFDMQALGSGDDDPVRNNTKLYYYCYYRVDRMHF